MADIASSGIVSIGHSNPDTDETTASASEV